MTRDHRDHDRHDRGYRTQGTSMDRNDRRDYGMRNDDRYGEGYGNQGYGQYENDYGDYGGSRPADRSQRMSGQGGYGGYDRGGYMRGDLGDTGMGRGYGGSTQGDIGERGGYGRMGYGAGAEGMGGMSTRGQHYGRGPKNYQRDNERVREDVNDQLTYHPDVDASNIEVKVENGEVTLTGTVSNRQQKRMAEDAAESARGVKDVHNQLRVQAENQGQVNDQQST